MGSCCIFYRVLHEGLNDVASGKEESKRTGRQYDRPKVAKEYLSHVKQLEQARKRLTVYCIWKWPRRNR